MATAAAATTADADSVEQSEKPMRWLPLESNPEVMTAYLHGLGVPGTWRVCDVLGLDPELLALVPGTVLAVLLLYPLTDKALAASRAEEQRVESDGQHLAPELVFMKQNIGNACGTVALIHAIANNANSLSDDNSSLKQFIDSLRHLSVEQRTEAMCRYRELSVAHETACQQGQTAPPSLDTPLDTHFIAFVHCQGHLYELDGRRPFPINHGPTTAASLLTDAATVVKTFMERDPEQMNFSVLALTESTD